MKIYTNGDSFTQPSNGDVDYSWPKQLSDLTGWSIVNEAAGCGSNSRALSNLLAYFHAGNKPDLVIIGLTSPQRVHLPSARQSSWSIGPTVINDRSGKIADSVLKWYVDNCYDQTESMYQYYSIIWQIHELCNNHINCPVLFINMWDSEAHKFDQMLFSNDQTAIKDWINARVDDVMCYTTLNYYKMFEFFAKERIKWHMPLTCLDDMLSVEHHMPNDMHPNSKGYTIFAQEIKKLVDNIL